MLSILCMSLMYLTYFTPFLFSFFGGLILTFLARRLALRWKIVDIPQKPRKIHKKPTPLLGGMAVFLSFILVILIYAFFTSRILDGYILPKHLIGIFLGGLFLMIGGALDDKFSLKPSHQIIWPILATLTIIVSGIGITYITNPLGGTLYLDTLKIHLFFFRGIPYAITFWADFFTLFWLMGMMYTTKFLDGLDGLATGVTGIGALIIFFLCLTPRVGQPETAMFAVILAGACLGFLVFNFHPARIFLGEGGSTFLGFMLGILAIISGGKIATALLIMGIPILDAVWVIIRRFFWERKPMTQADRKHLHFRLLDIGLSHRQAVIFLYFLTLGFGLLALYLQTREKLLALGILSGVMIVLGVSLVVGYRLKLKVKN